MRRDRTSIQGTPIYDTVVVGAGFAGAVIAERLASRLSQRVLVIDRREHIGGNAHDHLDDRGVLCHRHGPHIFHTQSPKVVEYLSHFTAWRPYEHRVLASVDGDLVPVPINRTTVNRLYGLELSSDREVQDYLAERAEHRPRLDNSEDVVVSKVGRDLYEKLFRGYTQKHWGADPSELHATVCGRIPVRFDEDDRYFADSFQSMPADGYTAMFERMLDHGSIEVRLGADYDSSIRALGRHLVYTGPIDEFYGHRFGKLPYRSLRFEHETIETPGDELVQPVAQINYPSLEVTHTRTTEYRHMTGQKHAWSTVATEYPAEEGDPYYPVPNDANRALYRRYEELARREDAVTFVGRLARYQYLNMDQVVAQALSTFRQAFGGPS